MATATLCFDRFWRNARLHAAWSLVAFLTGLTPLLMAQSAIPAQVPVFQPSSASVGAESALSPEELGDLQMVRKHFQAALQEYMQVSPKSAAVWNKIGIAQQQMFVTDEAKKSYETALKLDPKNADVMNNLGSVYYSRKEYGIAEHMYRKALKIKPKSALIYKNLGTDLLAENKFKKGWDCYQAALGIDPEVFERVGQLRIGEPTPTQKRGAMNYYLAKSYARVGMPDRAVGYLRMAIDEGFTDRKKVLADKEFAGLRGLSAFEQLISEQQISKQIQ
ncbi:tetratricopeptide repeat protein [Acidicapsa acidisoli]|uniref:tetratricopeptide repeat protein n=1 Tax=Acidicapsa acidisoli TaxID=1615681 RepID=UPI0021DFE6A3|nr:tetratricopeptide repeat protein [Acidicapsa acidisoli]